MPPPSRSIVTHRRLLVFRWLMVLIPPVTVAAGHLLVQVRPTHAIGHFAEPPIVILIATGLTLVLSYLFAGTMFAVFRRLQADALAREQEVLTMNAVMRERERLGRELHDGAAQLVAHLLLRLDTIKELVAANRGQEAAAELERLHGVADEIYEDIGESITGIRADVAERGLAQALQDYADRFEERYGISVRLRVDGAAGRVPPLAAYQLFRLIQEALTNVHKHAGARAATVTLAAAGQDRIRAVIADEGRGFAPEPGEHGAASASGLAGMRTRVEELGGEFAVDSRPGSGTRVVASIPLPGLGKEDGHAALAPPAG